MLFPILFKEGEDDKANAIIEQALIDSDKRIAQSKRVTPAYIYAIIVIFGCYNSAYLVLVANVHNVFIIILNFVPPLIS